MAVSVIAATFAVTSAFMLPQNPAERIRLGEPVKITAEVMPATAQNTLYFENKYEIVTPFQTLTIEDDTMFLGDTVVATEGVDGVRQITERIGFRGGEEVYRAAIASTVLVEAIDKVILVGTNPAPRTTSYGEYHWPAEGKLESGFGRRSVAIGSRNHQGLDITGDKGDPIYAADGGVVITADSKMSGYGNLVRILHDNGDVTYYAHNSELLVAEGDLVYRGQQIAEMGRTGTASGIHCHFELRIDEVPVDPIGYLPER